MEEIIDTFKKRDWTGFYRSLGVAVFRLMLDVLKTLNLVLRILILSFFVGFGLYFGLSEAVRWDEALHENSRVFYFLEHVAEREGDQ